MYSLNNKAEFLDKLQKLSYGVIHSIHYSDIIEYKCPRNDLGFLKIKDIQDNCEKLTIDTVRFDITTNEIYNCNYALYDNDFINEIFDKINKTVENKHEKYLETFSVCKYKFPHIYQKGVTKYLYVFLFKSISDLNN